MNFFATLLYTFNAKILAFFSKALMAQSSDQTPLNSEFVGSILATDSCEKCSSMLYRKPWVFSPGAPVSSQREI
jgi:hypothetical protein